MANMSIPKIRMPTNKELNENAVKTLSKRGFSEKTIVQLVTDNYNATETEVKGILEVLERNKQEIKN